ncbi:glycogen debranching protein GlgX [Novosphingobium sp. CECT 9465]|uniref:glycogen debranching protein GlgX n=1 Tax=Novosphingobium sp. CECT 9465 TaxID=2829794 RepID=UPI001E50B357|nr:glycogen debranching protein GlgX [Novosphingobium sp. CECT 9465]CAH0496937.1 Glycogen debranching enzyme [Novosphingobium sp. CECT 9465]
MTPGVVVADGKTRFTVRSPRAEALTLCLFENDGEQQVVMARWGDFWTVELPADLTGSRYGYRASGEWNPASGLWFDFEKLLVDPHAMELDGSFRFDQSLSTYGVDTASNIPKGIVANPEPLAKETPRFQQGGLIYEVSVRGLTMLHPDVPDALRGTVAALAHPAIVNHLKRLNVSAIELMPIVAWIDERHLPPLGLNNAWGYNPVAPMALDPRLCPGGVAELRKTVAALHAAGIGVILDIVLNHTGESDVLGPVLCLRGLDDATYAKAPDGSLINDTGCGNTLDFANPAVRALALDTLRHFVKHCGIDGFRFDLATILARSPGFFADAPIFAEIAADPWLSDRVLIAEPWDIGPGGYQLGAFPSNWLEWNDRFRDDVRRFWRGDAGVGVMATRIAGSADVFGKRSRSVNFLAAHDGFTLADGLAYEHRHNWANGEENRDGHGENFSWNNGVEGETRNPDVLAARTAYARAMLGTLFVSTGTILLTAGDEFGRSQRGNNNAYAQDNAITWVDWETRDRALEDYTCQLSTWRNERISHFVEFPENGHWQRLDGDCMAVEDWQSPETAGLRWSNDDYAFVIDRTSPFAGPA